jgi:hypothetical protein
LIRAVIADQAPIRLEVQVPVRHRMLPLRPSMPLGGTIIERTDISELPAASSFKTMIVG